MKLVLTDFANQYSQFRIEACYKFKREGNAVQEGDKIVFEIVVLELGKPAYIHSSSVEVTYTFSSKSPPTKPSPCRTQTNCLTWAQSKKSMPVLAPRRSGDYVWLTHSEQEACLITRMKVFNDQQFKLVFLRIAMKPTDSGKLKLPMNAQAAR